MFVLAELLSGRSVPMFHSVDHVPLFIFLTHTEQTQAPNIQLIQISALIHYQEGY